eukprot:gnl/TRDRNA2_/TRDRNA2_182262_c0_seq1.p1 gnl/TRDRNA2_/TRDRNA2_182262_c0~~gnl/TRDRNA2_/TRDRNA2_182262_c0_seq1.p1  ORF type:complete len:358 (-),score=57.40 gnl/TRDRNA2_/TRDRNA2_182262_c0_seq1:102-1175(-)
MPASGPAEYPPNPSIGGEWRKDLHPLYGGEKGYAGPEAFPTGADPVRLYGALEDQKLMGDSERMKSLNKRQRMNCVPLILSLFVPWALFLIIYGAVSFYTHYALPLTVTITLVVLLALHFYWLRCCVQAWLGHRWGGTWFFPSYVAVMCTLALILGWVIGDYMFWFWMKPIYDLQHLATYSNIDPSSHTLRNGEQVPTSGKRFQDAGKVYFKSNSELDQSKAMSFKNGDLYCAVPIVNPECEKNCGYDFWAVGLNCCSEDAADFRCGQYDNKKAKAGLRQVDESTRSAFRMAVVEAEGAYHIMSPHPLFFEWIEDPIKAVKRQEFKGYKRFVIAMFLSFIANALFIYLLIHQKAYNY